MYGIRPFRYTMTLCGRDPAITARNGTVCTGSGHDKDQPYCLSGYSTVIVIALSGSRGIPRAGCRNDGTQQYTIVHARSGYRCTQQGYYVLDAPKTSIRGIAFKERDRCLPHVHILFSMRFGRGSSSAIFVRCSESHHTQKTRVFNSPALK